MHSPRSFFPVNTPVFRSQVQFPPFPTCFLLIVKHSKMVEASRDQVVYVWKTSLPRQVLDRRVPLKHISEVQRRGNTLDFLRETQSYIRKIRHPELSQFQGRAPQRVKTSFLPQLHTDVHVRPSGSLTSLSQVETPVSSRLIVQARSCERLTEEMELEVKPYAITRYMPAQRSSQRVPILTGSGDKQGGKVFVNQDIEKFMHRFERRMAKQNRPIPKTQGLA